MFEIITIRNQGDLSRLIAKISGENCPVEMSVTIEVFEDTDFTPFFNALEENSIIRKLILNYPDDTRNTITQKVAEVLEKNSTLQKLDLSGNGINVEGARSLAFALKKNSTLKTLNLWHNRISDDGARAIADALRENRDLQTLNLSNNDISDEGAWAIDRALQENGTLHGLFLEDNDIGVEGARAIAKVLEENPRPICILPWALKGREAIRIFRECAQFKEGVEKAENDVHHPVRIFANGCLFGGEPSVLPQHNLNMVTSASLVSDFLGRGVKLSDTTPPKRSPTP